MKSTTRPGLSRALILILVRWPCPLTPPASYRRYSDDNFEYRHVALPKAMLKVIPKDYKLMMQKIELQKRESNQQDEALLNAFNDKRTHLEPAQQLTAVY